MTLHKRTRITQWLLLLFTLSMLPSCATPNVVPIVTDCRPKLDPIPVEVSQAMQPDSTDLLQRVSNWLKNSEQLLSSVTTN